MISIEYILWSVLFLLYFLDLSYTAQWALPSGTHNFQLRIKCLHCLLKEKIWRLLVKKLLFEEIFKLHNSKYYTGFHTHVLVSSPAHTPACKLPLKYRECMKSSQVSSQCTLPSINPKSTSTMLRMRPPTRIFIFLPPVNHCYLKEMINT